MKKTFMMLLAVLLLSQPALAQTQEKTGDGVDRKIDRLEALSLQYKKSSEKQQPLCVMCDFFADQDEYTEVFRWKFKDGKRILVETVHSVKEMTDEEAAAIKTPKTENYYINHLPGAREGVQSENVVIRSEKSGGSAAVWISTLSLIVLMILAVLVLAFLLKKLYEQFLALSSDQKKILSQQTSITKKQNDLLANRYENDFDVVIERKTDDAKKGDHTFTASVFLKNNSGHTLKIDRILMEHDHLDEHSIDKQTSKSANLYVGKILPAGETWQAQYELKMYGLVGFAKESGNENITLAFGIVTASLAKGADPVKTVVSFDPALTDDTVSLHAGKKLIKGVEIKETKAGE